MAYLLTEAQLNPPVSNSELQELLTQSGVKFPMDYLSFLQEHNGGEGFVGDNYIIIWKADELADFNQEYEVEQYAPGILLFGSDGGGEAYGFDVQRNSMPIVRIPFVGMDRTLATDVAENFARLFENLAVPT